MQGIYLKKSLCILPLFGMLFLSLVNTHELTHNHDDSSECEFCKYQYSETNTSYLVPKNIEISERGILVISIAKVKYTAPLVASCLTVCYFNKPPPRLELAMV